MTFHLCSSDVWGVGVVVWVVEVWAVVVWVVEVWAVVVWVVWVVWAVVVSYWMDRQQCKIFPVSRVRSHPWRSTS